VLRDKSALEYANGADSLGVAADASTWVAYFEIYNSNAGDSLTIDYEILNSANQPIQKGRTAIVSAGRITPSYLSVPEQGAAEKSRIKLNIQSGDDTLEVEQPLACNCPSGMLQNFDLQEAIEQMIYIAKNDEMKKLKAATGEQKVAEFQKFWEKRDPTPGTRKNEYYEEYYRRIDFASKYFGGNKNGWRTDMGMVFVKLGEPDYIDKPVNYSNYYDPISNRRTQVIWHYVKFQRRVIFRFDAAEYRIANLHEIFDLLNDEIKF
jgi:GWxTD domain-containing protein